MIHLDGIVFALQRYGGISVYFKALSAGLVGMGRQAELCLPQGHLKGKPPGPEEIRLKHAQPRWLERYRDYPCNSPVGHSSYYRLPAGGAKSVVTVYDFTYERFFPAHQKAVHCWQKNRAIRKADAVICISESTRRDLFTFLPDVPRHKVHMIYLGVNQAFTHGSQGGPGSQGVQAPSSLATPQPFFLYVGERSTYKNFLPVLAALENRTEHLVCVGGGHFTDIEQASINKHAPGRVHHLAWAEDTTLAWLYSQALALVFPALYEGFGIPVAEAMASGCPVIAANSSSIPEVAGQAGYLLDTVTADTLRNAFDEVQHSPRRADMISHGLERARQFSWEQCCNATWDVYSLLHSQHFQAI